MNIHFKIDCMYTWIRLSWMATTEKEEIIITDFLESTKQYCFKRKGSKKQYLFPLQTEDERSLIFEGHNLPLLVDSETNRFMGNACFNFVTDQPEQLKQYIVQHCINPDFESLAKIMVTPALNRDNKHEPPYTPIFTEYQTEE